MSFLLFLNTTIICRLNKEIGLLFGIRAEGQLDDVCVVCLSVAFAGPARSDV